MNRRVLQVSKVRHKRPANIQLHLKAQHSQKPGKAQLRGCFSGTLDLTEEPDVINPFETGYTLKPCICPEPDMPEQWHTLFLANCSISQWLSNG